MYGMPLSQALVFVIAVILIIGTTQRRYLHPFVAIVVVAAAFGYVAGFTTSVLTQNFGGGFAAMMYSPGLVIVAAGFISGLAETTMGVRSAGGKAGGLAKAPAVALVRQDHGLSRPGRRHWRGAGVRVCAAHAAAAAHRR